MIPMIPRVDSGYGEAAVVEEPAHVLYRLPQHLYGDQRQCDERCGHR